MMSNHLWIAVLCAAVFYYYAKRQPASLVAKQLDASYDYIIGESSNVQSERFRIAEHFLAMFV